MSSETVDLIGPFVFAALVWFWAWFTPRQLTFVRDQVAGRGGDTSRIDEAIDKTRNLTKWTKHIAWVTLALGLANLALHYM